MGHQEGDQELTCDLNCKNRLGCTMSCDPGTVHLILDRITLSVRLCFNGGGGSWVRSFGYNVTPLPSPFTVGIPRLPISPLPWPG